MNLYHYSDKYIKDILQPIFYGENPYTDIRHNGSIKRLYFYTTDEYIPEYYMKNKRYKYTVNVKKVDIYDLKSDKLDLKSRYNTIYDILNFIKKKYIGALYSLGNYDIVILFGPVKIDKIDSNI